MIAVHQSMVNVNGNRHCFPAITLRYFSYRDFGATVLPGELSGVGQRGEFDPGHRGEMDHVGFGRAWFQALTVADPLDLFMSGLGEQGLILLKRDIRKAKSSVRPGDGG